MKALHEVKREIVEVCRKIDAREYVAGRDGNVSVRFSARAIVITRAGVRKGDVTTNDLLVVDPSGRKLEGRGSPSTETEMHLRIYNLRADVRAVVHAHPPVATGFAAAGAELGECVLPEVIVGLGKVPLARYAAPGTPELSASLDPLIREHDAFLLENHGVVTVGEDVHLAHQRLETVEHAARVLLVARLLGGPRALGEQEVAALIAARPRYGVREGLASCELELGAPRRGRTDEEIANEVAGRVLAALRARPRSREAS